MTYIRICFQYVKIKLENISMFPRLYEKSQHLYEYGKHKTIVNNEQRTL